MTGGGNAMFQVDRPIGVGIAVNHTGLPGLWRPVGVSRFVVDT